MLGRGVKGVGGGLSVVLGGGVVRRGTVGIRLFHFCLCWGPSPLIVSWGALRPNAGSPPTQPQTYTPPTRPQASHFHNPT